MIKKTLPIPLYGGTLTIHVTDNIEKTLVEVGWDGELECDACCLHNVDGPLRYDLIFRKGRIQHGIIAHECFHLTHRIMKQINKPYDINNDEPEAYLMQHIVGEVYNFLKDSKIRISY